MTMQGVIARLSYRRLICSSCNCLPVEISNDVLDSLHVPVIPPRAKLLEGAEPEAQEKAALVKCTQQVAPGYWRPQPNREYLYVLKKPC